jgi:soluble lytic murein transglycosylase-like protein
MIRPLLPALRAVTLLALLGLLAACASRAPVPTTGLRLYDGYPAPGPPGDPWGPYIEQASARFGIPQQVIRAVIKKESRGRVRAVSATGARGLMQLMPATYAKLRRQYGFGADPFNPRDNIFAGAAYLREMRDAVGEKNMLAAYNAGPERVSAHLKEGVPLPNETRAYISPAASP